MNEYNEYKRKSQMNLIEFAKQEFSFLGYTPIEKLKESSPNRWIQENVLELIKVFCGQEGYFECSYSSKLKADYFRKLVMFEPLSPITGNDDEWEEIKNNIYRNKRLRSVFKKGKNGKPYYSYAIAWIIKANNFVYPAVWGTVKLNDGRTVTSSQYIRLPFEKKLFSVEIEKVDEEIYKLSKPEQLDKVFEYYDEFSYEED